MGRRADAVGKSGGDVVRAAVLAALACVLLAAPFVACAIGAWVVLTDEEEEL